MELVLEATKKTNCDLVDITGGAPELNPNFTRFVKEFRKNDHLVQVRTNLTVLLESGMEKISSFLKEYGVWLVASMPCYLEKNVDSQRGEHVYEKSIEA